MQPGLSLEDQMLLLQLQQQEANRNSGISPSSSGANSQLAPQ
jgi:hypothetical protein